MTRARSLSLLANSNIFTVDQSNSRVGIGSTIPDVKLDVDGNMNVSGTLTYEDVTNVETAGITTTGGLVVTGLGATIGGITTFFGDLNFGAAGVGGTVTTLGHAEFVGVVTASSFSGDGSGLTGVASTDNINTSTLAQFTGGVGIADSIFHIGDDNTAIRFPAADTFTVVTGGSEALRVDNGQKVLINQTTQSVSHPLQVTAASDAHAIAINGRSADDIGELTFFENDQTTRLGELQYRQDHANFRHRVGDIRFATGGTTERLRIHADGEVQILGENAAAGQTPLSVEGNYASSGNVDIQTWARSGGAVKAAMRYVDADTLLKFGTTTNHGFAFITNANERFRITNGGNTTTTNATAAGSLGVGTDSPGVASGMSRYLTLSAIAADNAVALELQGNRSGNDSPVGRLSFINLGTETARITVDSGTGGGANSNMIFATGGSTERLRIASSGQIGLGGANYGTAGQVITSNGSGSAPTWQDASGGISTQAGTASGIVTSMFLNDATDHKVTATGICTITTTQSGTEGQSHTIRIVNSGIATVGFSTYFLFPSGSAPVLPTASGAVSLISFTVHDSVGAGCTQLLAGASVNFS